MLRTIFIGQAMPKSKRDLHDWPTLNAWLYKIGITDAQIRQHFYYSALVDYYPGSKNGSHLVPTHKQITEDRKRLTKTILDFQPEIVVTVGKLSAQYCLNRKINSLSDIIGQKFITDPYLILGREVLVIPLPHPSGASVWHHKPENKKLLQRSLGILLKYLHGQLS